ncbi:unnamed protein product, partial [Gulo gulo]
EILAPRERSFQPEIPEPAAVPWQKRPRAEPWASVCRQRTPPLLLVSLTNRNHFPLPPKPDCIQKFLTSLKTKSEKLTTVTQKSPQIYSSIRVKKQRQTQMQHQGSRSLCRGEVTGGRRGPQRRGLMATVGDKARAESWSFGPSE